MAFKWSFGLCMFTEVNADGFIGYQPDSYGEKESGAPPLESFHPYGFLSRPRDPDIDPNGNPIAGCSLLYFYSGGDGFALPTQDPRDLDKLPSLKPGESMQYGGAANALRCHADGSISAFTTDDGSENGRAIYFNINPTDGFEWSGPWGRMTFGPLGFHMLHASGASIDVGSIAAPSPLDILSSYATLRAAMVAVVGQGVSLGTDGGAANQTAVTLLTAYLAYLTDAISKITSGTPGAAALTASQVTFPAFAGCNDGASATAALTTPLLPIGKVL